MRVVYDWEKMTAHVMFSSCFQATTLTAIAGQAVSHGVPVTCLYDDALVQSGLTGWVQAL